MPVPFAAGVPPDATFQTVLGPGLRITCQSDLDVRFLAQFTPEDAAQPFGVLRFDPRTVTFLHERADARSRLRIGEGFVMFGRYDVALAAFEAAAADRRG